MKGTLTQRQEGGCDVKDLNHRSYMRFQPLLEENASDWSSMNFSSVPLTQTSIFFLLFSVSLFQILLHFISHGVLFLCIMYSVCHVKIFYFLLV